MKARFLKMGFVLLFLFSVFYEVRASDCYRYHTRREISVKVENGKVFLVNIIKDPNGISVVSYGKKLLEGVSPKDARFVSINGDYTIVADAYFYYVFPDSEVIFEKYKSTKIIENKKVTKVMDGNLFLISGVWHYLDFNIYSNEFKFVPIPEFPVNPVVLASGYRSNDGYFYIMKDDKKVYSYRVDQKKMQDYPDLNPKTTQIFKEDETKFFLYDEDTFYLVDFPVFTDVTAQFRKQDFDGNFNNLKVRQIWLGYCLDFGNEGGIWFYSLASLKGIGDVYFVASKAEFKPESKLFFYKDRAYLNLRNELDISEVKHKEKLKQVFEDVYSDGENNYELRLGMNSDAKLVLNPNLQNIDFEKFVFYKNQGLYSYQGQPAFWADGKNLFYWERESKTKKNISSYKSKIKDLKLAFVFDDKILIEKKIIKNIGDFATMEFVGSSVEVVSPCDGNGKSSVKVNYVYYFRDKNALYLYKSGQDGLKKLNVANPKEYTKENFLEKIFRNASFKF